MLMVETNSIVGYVWEERSVLKRIVSLCRQFGVLLVVPEVSLAEARASLLNRIDRQLSSLQQLRFWLNDIARSAGMERMVRSVKRGLDAIETELQRRRREASAALSTFAQAGTIAPLTPQVWTKAYLRWQANMPPFRELDCLVMESLLAFLQRQKAKLTMFLTLDVEDFDHPEVREEFQRRKTLLLFEPRDVIVEFRKFYGVM